MKISLLPKQPLGLPSPPGVTAKQSEASECEARDAQEDHVHIAGKEVPRLRSTLGHKVALGACAATAGYVAVQIAGHVLGQPGLGSTLLQAGTAVLAGAAGYQATDLFSGFFHHTMDNYAKPSTPLVGETAALAKAHHYFANSPQQSSVAHELGPIAKWVLPGLVATAAIPSAPMWLSASVVGGLAATLVANLSHRWTHEPRPSKLAKLAQDLRLTQGRNDHQAHHRAPWASNYCFVNGTWNNLLDKTHFWRKWEVGVYRLTGTEAKSWNHPAVKDFALGKIDSVTYQARLTKEVAVFRQNIGFEQEREESRAFLHARH